VRRQPDRALAHDRADQGQLLGTLLHLTMKLRHVGVAGVGREPRRQPVHADIVALEVVQDVAQALQRATQMRVRAPAARVVRGQPAVAQHLDGEAEPVRAGQQTVHGRMMALTVDAMAARALPAA
jgi:hypothetical protein